MRYFQLKIELWRRAVKFADSIPFVLFFLLFQAGVPFAQATDNPAVNPYACPDCNIIMISVTNLRADHLASYGYRRKTSPAIDSLAKKSVVFSNASSVASWTLPVAMSVFTSRYPLEHKVMVRETDQKIEKILSVRSQLSPEEVTLFDILKQNGYYAVSINAGVDYLPEHGLTSRADWGVSYATDLVNNWGKYGSANDVVPEAIRWLQNNSKRKFFLQMQVYDTHCPFAYPVANDKFDPDYKGDVDFTKCYCTYDKADPVTIKKNGVEKKYYVVSSPDHHPEDRRREFGTSLTPTGSSAQKNPEEGKDTPRNGLGRPYEYMLDERDVEHMVALYDGEIYGVDAQLGHLFEVLKKLNLYKKTIIVFFSEHGDMFGKHGRFMRGGPLRGTFYEDVLHVPLMIYHPRIKPQKIEPPVSLVDVAPSLLSFLQIQPPTRFNGENLVPLLAESSPRERKIYAGSMYVPPVKVARPDSPRSLSTYFLGATIVLSVKDKNMKLIRETVILPSYQEQQSPVFDNRYELYNLNDDPAELNNLQAQLPGIRQKLEEDMNSWFQLRKGVVYSDFLHNLAEEIDAQKKSASSDSQ